MTIKKLDAKFYGNIYKAKDNKRVGDDEYLVFLAHDDALLAALDAYYDECVRLGCDAEQIESARQMRYRVTTWRIANPDKCKLPGAAGERRLTVENADVP